MSARTPEGRISERIVRWLNTQPHTVAHKVHGGAFGPAGEPDVDAVSHGRAVKLEVKTPGTEASIAKRVTPLQRRRLRDYLAADAVAAVVTSLDEVQLLLAPPRGPALSDDERASLAAIRARLDEAS